MIRTTPEAVAAIIAVDPSIDLIPFIDTAAALVDVVVAEGKIVQTDRVLCLIETWLAAHVYATRDPRAVKEKAGPVEATYQNSVGLGLKNSHYGQMAMQLDASGMLRLIDIGRPKANIVWLGTEC